VCDGLVFAYQGNILYKRETGLNCQRRVTKTGKNLRLISRIFLPVILLLVLVLPILVEISTAQTQLNYYVTVNPTRPNSPMYTTVGRNWTVSFEALWSYGDNSGQGIRNATVTVQVTNNKSAIIDTRLYNTAAGLFSFNYSSLTADVLTFTPTKLVTQNGTEWTSKLLDAGNNLYGFQSESVVIWWDTFHVSLVSYNTETLGFNIVSVNITYLLLPENGLTLPESATYSHQTFLPKIANNANVTINGVAAEEISMGVFTANVSIWLPTSYILVEVSQEGWTTTHTGFSFVHNANEPLWGIATAISLVFVLILTSLFAFFRKSRDKSLSRQKSYAIFGGVLLAITSVISLYWGLVGLDSTLNGFEWVFLTVLGFLSFSFGLVAGVLSIRRKNQALVIFAVVVPMFTNLVGVKYSLDIYHLANPWLFLIVPLVLSIISGFLVSNADEAFN
jgi:hypothetical protein